VDAETVTAKSKAMSTCDWRGHLAVPGGFNGRTDVATLLDQLTAELEAASERPIDRDLIAGLRAAVEAHVNDERLKEEREAATISDASEEELSARIEEELPERRSWFSRIRSSWCFGPVSLSAGRKAQ
jgi:hypothetical protein